MKAKEVTATKAAAAKAEAVAAAKATPSPPLSLKRGDRVTVKGTSRDDLNGQSGTVKDYDAAQERFNVTLDNGKVFALRSRNLQKLKGDGEAKGETKGGRGEKEGASPSKGLQALRDAEIDRLDRNLYGAKKGSPEKPKKGSPGR